MNIETIYWLIFDKRTNQPWWCTQWFEKRENAERYMGHAHPDNLPFLEVKPCKVVLAGESEEKR